MSLTYNISTNFGAKDTLPSGDPAKVIRGSDFTTEFQSIQAVFQTAAPSASPTFTGTVTAPTFSGAFSGNLTGDVTGNVTGNASGSASAWATPRTITFTGAATGSVVLDGSSDESVAMTVSPTGHVHSAYDHSAHLSGATVFDQINVVDGIVNSVATRTITLSDLGFTGDPAGNNYTHPTYNGDDINIDTGALSGATVISDLDFNVTTDTLGHVTDANATVSTRTLTAANIGALSTSGTAADSSKLGGQAAANYLRSNTSDTFTGTLSVTGSVVATGNITAYSDARLKTDVGACMGLSAVEAMNGYNYTMNEEICAGVIAQELEEVAPELVIDNVDGFKSVNYMGLTAYLIEAVKDLSAKVRELEAK